MPSGSAIHEIMQMRQQGLSNNQIIQNLQRTGWSNTQIFDAMNQADTKMAVEGIQPAFVTQSPQQSHELFTAPPQDFVNVQVNPNQTTNNSVRNIMNEQPSQVINQQHQEKIEELVEAIIEEKWVEIVKDINKIVDWKNRVESRISEIEVKLEGVKDNLSDLNKAIVGKVSEYDKHILEVGSDLQAMEKVFTKVLPSLTENVTELSKLVNKMKGKEA